GHRGPRFARGGPRRAMAARPLRTRRPIQGGVAPVSRDGRSAIGARRAAEPDAFQASVDGAAHHAFALLFVLAGLSGAMALVRRSGAATIMGMTWRTRSAWGMFLIERALNPLQLEDQRCALRSDGFAITAVRGAL